MRIDSKKIGAALLAATVLTLGACATLHQREAQSTEQVLAAAGFKAKPADTPERIANLNTMPPRKLVAHTKDGHFVYVYADPDNCHCLYVGGPEEYSAYQRLSLQREIAQEEQMAAMDWEMWGPWVW